jgi:hypothetical protein
MPKVTIAHQPELTKEQTMEIFATAFGDRYRVAPFRGLFRDFVIEKNAFTGVAVKLEQSSTETKLIYNAFTSRWWARLLLGVIIGPIPAVASPPKSPSSSPPPPRSKAPPPINQSWPPPARLAPSPQPPAPFFPPRVCAVAAKWTLIKE